MKIKVLLLKDVSKLGGKGEIVEVSDSVFRNVLKPKGEAQIADKKVIKEWEKSQKRKQEEELKIKQAKEKAIEDMKNNGLEMLVSSNGDHLYEKIDKKHIIEEILNKYKIKFLDKELDFPEKKVNKLGKYIFNVIFNGKKNQINLTISPKQ